MSQFRSKKSLSLLLTSFFVLATSTTLAQTTPSWVPVAELLLGSIGQSDATRMTEVMHRCTALNMTLSALTADDFPEISEGYEHQALQLIQNGIMIQMNTEKLRTGIEAVIEQQSDLAVGAVKNMLAVYSQWLEDNFQDKASYFSNDLEVEMKGCELATKLILQKPAL
ncbi:MAG: hypothetical protein RQ899_09415 [Pseudomonadales bacterium]|nr:hypothetical protein [Pseudomonadales bacterium]